MQEAWQAILPGAVAGFIANAICHPLDTIKTLTLQVTETVRPCFVPPLWY